MSIPVVLTGAVVAVRDSTLFYTCRFRALGTRDDCRDGTRLPITVNGKREVPKMWGGRVRALAPGKAGG